MGGPASLGKRLWQLLAGLAALVAAAGWWVAIDLLTPAADRPYVGGSTDNNILQLTFGYNGLGGLTGTENSAGGGGTAPRLSGAAARLGEGAARTGTPPSGGGGGGSLFGGATGITRLFQSDMGSQISWLLPAALIALVALLWLSWRSPRTDRTRAAALLWGGWLVVTGLVFSYMSGIIHPYYTVALVPAIAALAGIGAAGLWRIRHTWSARIILAGTLLVTATWAWVLLGRSPDWFPWLRVAIAIAAAAAAAMILAGPALRAGTSRGRTALAIAPLALALAAGLGGPLAYSIDTAATAHGGSIPTAGPTVTGSSGGPGVAGRTTSGFPGGASRSGTAPGGTVPAGAAAPAGRPQPAGRRLAGLRRAGAAAPAGRPRPAGPRGRRPGRFGQRQRRPVPAARIRSLRLQMGRGHHRLHQRGLARTGQQRGPGHGDRRVQRQRPGPDPGPVREAGLRARDPLLRGQRTRALAAPAEVPGPDRRSPPGSRLTSPRRPWAG